MMAAAEAVHALRESGVDWRVMRGRVVMVPCLALAACQSTPPSVTSPASLTDASVRDGATARLRDGSMNDAGAPVLGAVALGSGQWQAALAECTPDASASPTCEQAWCAALASTGLFVDQFDAVVVPEFSSGVLSATASNAAALLHVAELLDNAAAAVDAVAAEQCTYVLPHMPFVLGIQPKPIVNADIRGAWTPRSAQLLGATLASLKYIFGAVAGTIPPPPASPGFVPTLPTLLNELRTRELEADTLLWSEQADPTIPRGGWLDRDGDGVPSAADELLIDLFEPATDTRVFDFSTAKLVRGDSLPLGALTPTAALPAGACAYRAWHVDTLIESTNVGTTDGLSYSPDGARLAFPMKVSGTYQVHIANADGTSPVCITCANVPTSWNDGVRWRPGAPSTLLFISNRDHLGFSFSGAGGGAGQELYAMRADGTQQTRLTVSDTWATNYHANFSPDGSRIVWGSTEARAWDVMVADFVDDAAGMRLSNVQRVIHDTTWWETHGFTADGGSIITTNTRAGFLETDIYAVDLATGARTRLTNYAGWDEHAHLSPGGRELAWISGRWAPTSMVRFEPPYATLSPVWDFFWILPGIYFTYLDQPAGYSTELTMMDADGTNLQRLTNDGAVVADNEWSPDGKHIVYREASTAPGAPGAIRTVTFDDCGPCLTCLWASKRRRSSRDTPSSRR